MINREVREGALVISEDGAELISIRETPVDDRMRIAVSGGITSETAPYFADELMTAVTVSNSLEIDLSGVEFISSAGFKALLNTQKTIDGIKGKSLRLFGISERLMNSFEDIGFDGLFDIAQ